MNVARPWVRLGILASSLVGGCKFTHGELQPRMGDGGSDGQTVVVCSDRSITCDEDTLRVCSGAGAIANDTQCGWGCLASEAPPRCAVLVPSGNGGVASDGVMPSDVTGDGLGDIILPDGVTIDSDFGNIGTSGNTTMYHIDSTGLDKGIDFQRRGAVAMFRLKSLRITGTVTLVGAYPIALVADGAIEIAGVIDARGVCSAAIAGPGGFNGGATQGSPGLSPVGAMGGGEGATAISTGGGGGGYGGNGAAAKSVGGGAPFGDPEITTLRGGGGGGAGADSGSFGVGGGGGGALQLISNTRIVITSGGLNAGGCGGKAGTGGNESGGGGGGGGALLLEAPRVLIAGALAVNGGGGGGGGGAAAQAGANGTLDRTIAAAGQGNATDEGGGTGAIGGIAAGPGAGGNNPGGGGGGVGRIRINTRVNLGLMLDGAAVLSPSFDDPSTTCTRGSASVR